MQHPPSLPPSGERRPARSRAGRASLGPLLLVMVALVLAPLLWLRPWETEAGTRGVDGATPEVGAGPGESSTPDAPPEGPARPGEDGLRDEGGIQVTERRDPLPFDRSYEGLGILSGSVSLPSHLPMPATWELVIEPSLFGVGREHAGTRRRTFEGAQTTFEEHDLPLGGYRVYARAAGMNGLPQEVEIYRIRGQEHLPGKSHVHLLLALEPGSWVEASVRDPEGGLVPDVPVVLLRARSDERFETTTNGNGVLRFEGLEDGHYVLVLGSSERPLVPRREFSLVSPGVQLEDLVLPALGSLHLRVTDARGRPLEGVAVRGFGPAPVDVVSGFDGQVRVPFLPAGEYDLRVEDEATGHEGRLTARVELGEEPALLTLVCQVR